MITTTLEIACPRCTKPLTDPEGLGWCSSCGYCKSLEETKVAPTPAAPKAAPEPEINVLAPPSAPLKATDFFPVWAMVLVLGMGLLVGGAIYVGKRLPAEGLPRALWTTVQLGAGLLILFIAQFAAALRLGPKDPTLSFKDVIMPFRLWTQVFKNLPAQQVVLWLGGWALSLILSACIFIGGLGHWMTYLPGGKNHGNNTKNRR